jgi:hypothetical protein
MANLGDGLQVNPTSPQTGRSGARNNWMPSLRFGRSSLTLNQPLSTLPPQSRPCRFLLSVLAYLHTT